MRLDSYDEFAEYVLDKFENEEDITVVCNYELADILNYYFGDEEYHEYKGIDLQSDVNEYYVTKFDKDFFCITPIKYEGKIKTTTGNYFIIDTNILEENPTLFSHLEGDNFKVEIVDYEEDCYCCDDEKGRGILEYNYDYSRAALENVTDEEDLMYLQLADLIEDYVGLILDNDCKEEVLGHALTEFAGKILENFCLEKE